MIKFEKNFVAVTGDRLCEFTDAAQDMIPRDVVQAIFNYLNDSYTMSYNSVFILHGIRRTGKTVAMVHAIDKLIKYGVSPNDIIYINITNVSNTKEVKLDELVEFIENSNKKYVFIDEVTRINDFMDGASVLSDTLSIGRKIVITGTDSFVFPHTVATSLYGRAITYRTTFIRYAEDLRIHNIKPSMNSIENYNIHGGLLIPRDFENISSARINIEKATFVNIRNSVYRNRNILQFISKDFVNVSAATSMYILFNLINNSVNPRQENELNRGIIKIGKDSSNLVFPDMIIEVDTSIKLKTVTDAIKAFSDLDIIRYIPNICKRADTVVNIETDYEIVTMIQELLFVTKTYKINTDRHKGQIFENFIASQVLMQSILNNNKYIVEYCKYRYNNIGHEVDLVVTLNDNFNSKIFAIEIKYSNTANHDYAKHIRDDSLKLVLGNEFKKYIVYNGETFRDRDVQYINSNDFLLNLDTWLS